MQGTVDPANLRLHHHGGRAARNGEWL